MVSTIAASVWEMLAVIRRSTLASSRFLASTLPTRLIAYSCVDVGVGRGGKGGIWADRPYQAHATSCPPVLNVKNTHTHTPERNPETNKKNRTEPIPTRVGRANMQTFLWLSLLWMYLHVTSSPLPHISTTSRTRTHVHLHAHTNTHSLTPIHTLFDGAPRSMPWPADANASASQGRMAGSKRPAREHLHAQRDH